MWQHEIRQRPVVEREHVVALGLSPPETVQLGQLVGLPLGQVLGFGRVGGHVVQLPRHLVEARLVELNRVIGDRLPAIVVDRPAPEHLEVLSGAVLRSGGVAEGGGK